MMTRHLFLLFPLLVVAADLPAQGDLRSPAPPATPPSGWQWRFDSVPGEGWTFAEMPPGFHLTTTTSGVTLAVAGSEAPARRHAAARVILFPPGSTLDEGYGMIMVDHRFPDSWLAFLVRRGGEVGVMSRRAGSTTMVEPWRRVAAVALPDTTGFVENLLAVEADPEWLTFLVNDSVAARVPRSAAPPGSEVGFRVGAGLNMHVTSFDLVRPMATPRPRRPPEG